MISTPRLLPLSWGDLDRAVEYLAERLTPAVPHVIGVYGVPRGGLPLAVALSHRLGLPYLEHPGRLDPFIYVDDIHDSGKTLREADQRWPRIIPAFWVYRGRADDTELVAALYHDADDWFVFPWESKAQARQDRADYLARRAGR